MHAQDYAKIICAMSDIPVHKLQNNKPVIESLHVLFTLFSEFRSNQHFQQQNNDPEVDPNLANFWEVSHKNETLADIATNELCVCTLYVPYFSGSMFNCF